MSLSVKIFTFVMFCCLATTAASEPIQGSERAVPDDDILKVFLDCGSCDVAFVRREVGFVNYVRDRALAQVHILVTSQQTGSGGRIYSLTFIESGSEAEEGLTLTYVRQEEDSYDTARKGLTEAIKRGLMPFVLETSVADRITISYEQASEEATREVQSDPWNSWVFEVYAGGFMQQEESQGRLDIRYGVFANRVTDKWRIRIRPYFNNNFRRFETSDESIRDVAYRHGFDGFQILSLTDHWSAGLFQDVLSSTFTNMDLRLQLAVGLEYSLFPYDISERKEITFRYRVHSAYFNYMEETLFGKLEEQLFRHSISATMRFQQPWGFIATGLMGSHYLHDTSLNRLEFDSRVQLRVVKGLQMSLSAGFEVIHDQLFLEKGDATLDEILLQRRQLATAFELTGRIGLSYTFGSIYNNVVNTRF